MNDLLNLLLAYFDGPRDCYIVEETEVFGEKFFRITFSDRVSFSDFEKFVNVRWNSWHEDDHNLFDLKPFLIDIGYSDMIILLDGKIKNNL